MTSRHEGGCAPWVLAAMCAGLMLSMFNATQVNVTVPTIARALHASPTGSQWVLAAYTLCYAALLLPGGALGNRWGRRRAFLVGIAVFDAASLACALAPSLGVLLSARAVQALGAATMLPQTLAIIVHEYRDPTARSRAVGVWAGVASLGLAAGPVLGGLLVGAGSWRWGFALSAVLGAVALGLAAARIPPARHGPPARPPRMDVLGAGLSVVALGSLVFGLIESQNVGWTSPVIIVSFVIALVGVYAFVMVERAVGAGEGQVGRGGRRPVMPLSIWRSRQLVAANIAGVAYFFCFFGVLYFLSVDLQQHRGASAAAAGAAFLPLTLVTALLGPIAGRLAARVGPAPVLVVGLLVGALGCALLARDPVGSSLLALEGGLVVLGVGAGLMSSPMSNLAVSSVEDALSSTASAVHNACRQVGSTLGVAALGAVVGSVSFPAGLSRAMLTIAAVLAASAVATAALTRRSGRGAR